MKRLFLLLAATSMMTSCATIFSGTSAKVTFDSNIKEADAFIVDGRVHEDVTFPYKTKVKRGYNESVVVVQAEGYMDNTTYIDKKFNTVSLLNIFWYYGLVAGAAVDAATGSITKPDQKEYYINMKAE